MGKVARTLLPTMIKEKFARKKFRKQLLIRPVFELKKCTNLVFFTVFENTKIKDFLLI